MEVMKIMSPGNPNGTAIWASWKVMRLLTGREVGIDAALQDRIIRKLQHFCDGNFKIFMPEAVKREHGEVFGVHLNQIRIAGFFAGGHGDFIAIDWFIKKVQQNDRRMMAIYEKVESAREMGSWQKVD